MTTRIHALLTGTATIKEALRRGQGEGIRRRAALLTGRRWSEPLPIHCWLIEHADGPILVDAGALAGGRDLPFVRFDVSPEDEVDRRVAAAGTDPGDLRLVVLTHAHGDHIDGLARLPPGVPQQIGRLELADVRSRRAAIARRALRIPLPAGFDPGPLPLAPEPFGAFSHSARLTEDGTVVAVPTPGHTPGHVSVVVVIDGRHHFLAGDATYDQEQLHALRVDGLSPDDAVARETMRTIARHAGLHPTVYLPSHDPESPARLRRGEVLSPG